MNGIGIYGEIIFKWIPSNEFYVNFVTFWISNLLALLLSYANREELISRSGWTIAEEVVEEDD